MAAAAKMRRSGLGHPGITLISSDKCKKSFVTRVQSTVFSTSASATATGDLVDDGDHDHRHGQVMMITPTISVTTIVRARSRKRKSSSGGAAGGGDGDVLDGGICNGKTGGPSAGDDGQVAPKMSKFVAPSSSTVNPRKRKSTTANTSMTDSGFNDSLDLDDDVKIVASVEEGDGNVASGQTTLALETVVLPLIAPSPIPPVTFGDAEEIWEYMCKMDEKYTKDADLLKCHPSLSPQMRSILFDWMMDVCEAYNLHRETLYLSFDYLDRYLQAAKTGVLKHHLQLIGITALFIAAKVEEIYPPKLSTFAYVTDGACSVTDIVQMENLIMKKLKWQLHPITPSSWTNLFLQISSIASNATSPNKYTEVILRTMRSARGEVNNRRLLTTEYEKVDFVRCMRILDLSIMDIQSLKYSYSTLAAASLYHVKGRKACLTASGMTWENLAPCVFWMAPFAQVAAKSDIADVLPGISGVADEYRHLVQSQCVSLSMLEEVHLKEKRAKLSSPIAKITEGLLTPPSSHEKNPNHSVRSPRRKARRC